ncbi:MAG: lipoprotein [Pseudolabrys sp.]|nr:lipoprotein [Pseudolabrys sp.]
MNVLDRPPVRLALAGALVALTLAACGRKGPLDPPPAAAAAGEQQTAAANRQEALPEARPSNLLGGSSSSGRLPVPKGEKKHIFLDDILN